MFNIFFIQKIKDISLVYMCIKKYDTDKQQFKPKMVVFI